MFRKLLLSFATAAAATGCFAGTFDTAYFSSNDIANVGSQIADLVSDDFTQRFPASQYQIVVISSESHTADMTCFATVGIVRKQQNGNVPVPIDRFSATRFIKGGGTATAQQRRDCEIGVIRTATRSMLSESLDQLATDGKL